VGRWLGRAKGFTAYARDTWAAVALRQVLIAGAMGTALSSTPPAYGFDLPHDWGRIAAATSRVLSAAYLCQPADCLGRVSAPHHVRHDLCRPFSPAQIAARRDAQSSNRSGGIS